MKESNRPYKKKTNEIHWAYEKKRKAGTFLPYMTGKISESKSTWQWQLTYIQSLKRWATNNNIKSSRVEEWKTMIAMTHDDVKKLKKKKICTPSGADCQYLLIHPKQQKDAVRIKHRRVSRFTLWCLSPPPNSKSGHLSLSSMDKQILYKVMMLLTIIFLSYKAIVITFWWIKTLKIYSPSNLYIIFNLTVSTIFAFIYFTSLQLLNTILRHGKWKDPLSYISLFHSTSLHLNTIMLTPQLIYWGGPAFFASSLIF